jgi:hypothetical protein
MLPKLHWGGRKMPFPPLRHARGEKEQRHMDNTELKGCPQQRTRVNLRQGEMKFHEDILVVPFSSGISSRDRGTVWEGEKQWKISLCWT